MNEPVQNNIMLRKISYAKAAVVIREWLDNTLLPGCRPGGSGISVAVAAAFIIFMSLGYNGDAGNGGNREREKKNLIFWQGWAYMRLDTAFGEQFGRSASAGGALPATLLDPIGACAPDSHELRECSFVAVWQ